MTQTQIIYLVLAPILVWRFYSRYRKLVGRQEARPRKLWLSVILFPLLFIVIGLSCMNNSSALLTLLAGGVGGIALSFLGLRLTRFEEDAGKLFYTPNAYIGMGLMMVLVARVAYRFSTMAGGPMSHDAAAAQSLSNSPLTLFIVGVLFCYYAPYSAGILRRHAKAKAAVANAGAA